MEDDCFTVADYLTMKIDITRCFAEKYGLTIPDTIDLFQKGHIYEYLDRGGDMFITKRYEFMVNRVADVLGYAST